MGYVGLKIFFERKFPCCLSLETRVWFELTWRSNEIGILRMRPAMAEAFLKCWGEGEIGQIFSPTTRAGSGVAKNLKGGA